MSERLNGREQLEFTAPLEALIGVRGVVGGMVATEEGLPLAARLGSELDEEGLAAAAAAVGGLASKTLIDLGRGDLEVAVLDASKFRFLVQPIAVGYLLVVAEPDANVGRIVTKMTDAAATLEETAADLVEPRVAQHEG